MPSLPENPTPTSKVILNSVSKEPSTEILYRLGPTLSLPSPTASAVVWYGMVCNDFSAM